MATKTIAERLDQLTSVFSDTRFDPPSITEIRRMIQTGEDTVLVGMRKKAKLFGAALQGERAKLGALEAIPLTDDPDQLSEHFEKRTVVALAVEDLTKHTAFLGNQITERETIVNRSAPRPDLRYWQLHEQAEAPLMAELHKLRSLPYSDRPDVQAAILNLEKQIEHVRSAWREQWNNAQKGGK